MNSTTKNPPPLVVRLTADERAELERKAGSLTLSAYVRQCVFNTHTGAPRSTARRATPDKTALAQILAKVGHGNLAASLGDLAEAARIGALPVTPETESAIARACADIAGIKSLLMKALGIQER